MVALTGVLPQFKHRAALIPRLLKLVGRVPSYISNPRPETYEIPSFVTQDTQLIDNQSITRVKISITVPQQPNDQTDHLSLDKNLPSFEQYKNPPLRSGTDQVTGYMLVPRFGRERLLPAALCLHQTTVPQTLGSAEAAGVAGDPTLMYGLDLARRGYIALCIDYPEFGNYHPELYNHAFDSAVGKSIVNNAFAMSLLSHHPRVDPARIAIVGHSLGASMALLTACFEPRTRAVVASCGLTTWQAYANHSRWFSPNQLSKQSAKQHIPSLDGWSREKYFPLIKSQFDNSVDRVTNECFDWPDVMKALNDDQVPTFISAPTEDPIFDFEGAKQCLPQDQNHITAVHPPTRHAFDDATRLKAWKWLDRQIEHKAIRAASVSHGATFD